MLAGKKVRRLPYVYNGVTRAHFIAIGPDTDFLIVISSSTQAVDQRGVDGPDQVQASEKVPDYRFRPTYSGGKKLPGETAAW